jgi:multidrug efflux pump subunit AcrB
MIFCSVALSMLISSTILPWRATIMRSDSAVIFRQIGGNHHHRQTFLDIVLRTTITAFWLMIHAPIAFYI